MASTAGGVELATAYVTLAMSTKGAEGDIRKLFGGVKRQASTAGTQAGSAMGGSMVSAAKKFAGPLLAAFGIGVIAKQVGDMVTAGSDFQQAIGGVDAVFKKQANGIKQAATEAANALGLPTTAYLELATVLGAGLKNKGLKDFEGQTQKLIALGADLAAQYGGSTKDAIEAISSLMRGEADPIERYGIGINETAVNAELARKGLKGLKGAALDQAKAQARVDLLFKQSKDALGAFARESDTYAGKQQRLRAAWADIKTQIGTALLPALTGLSEWFLKKGVPAIQDFATFIQNTLIPGIGGIYDLLVKGDFTKKLNAAFGWAEDSKPVDFLFKVRDGFLRVKDAVTGLFELFSTGEFTEALARGFGIEENSPVVGVLLGIRDSAIEAWGRIKQVGGWIKDDLWPVLKDGYERIMPRLKQAFADVVEAFKGDGMGQDFQWRDLAAFITDRLIPAIVTLVEVWIPVAVKQFLLVKDAVEKVWGAMKFLLGVQGTFISGLITGLSGITEAAANMLDALSNVPGFGWAKDAANKLRDATERARELRDAINGIPKSRRIEIIAQVSMPGRIALPGGEKVNIGLREAGGPVRKGQPYIVGEKRPELFVPNQSGTILPRVPTTAGASSSGAAYNFYGPIQASDPMELDRKLKERARFASLTGGNR